MRFMTNDIRKQLHAVPFVPFTIFVADGREYRVPSPDHAHVHPNLGRVSLYSDEGLEAILPALLISGIQVAA
jgi:hypothetical protein